MGAGNTPGGGGPAGQDAVLAQVSPNGRTAPLAPLYDLATRDYRINADGTYASVHPVDSEVEHRLGILAGWLGSSPAIGSTLQQIAYITSSLQADATTRVQLALAPMIDRGDVALREVSVTERPYGGFVCAVSYSNLRLDATAARSVEIAT